MSGAHGQSENARWARHEGDPAGHLLAGRITKRPSYPFRREESGSREPQMPVIKIRDNEPFEVAMKRFKKQCEKAGILSELKRREYYDKPSIRKKKKAAAARKRALKKMRRMAR